MQIGSGTRHTALENGYLQQQQLTLNNQAHRHLVDFAESNANSNTRQKKTTRSADDDDQDNDVPEKHLASIKKSKYQPVVTKRKPGPKPAKPMFVPAPPATTPPPLPPQERSTSDMLRSLAKDVFSPGMVDVDNDLRLFSPPRLDD